MEIVFFAELNATLKEAEGSTSQPTSQPATAAVVVVGIIGMTNNKEVYQVSETIQSEPPEGG